METPVKPKVVPREEVVFNPGPGYEPNIWSPLKSDLMSLGTDLWTKAYTLNKGSKNSKGIADAATELATVAQAVAARASVATEAEKEYIKDVIPTFNIAIANLTIAANKATNSTAINAAKASVEAGKASVEALVKSGGRRNKRRRQTKKQIKRRRQTRRR